MGYQQLRDDQWAIIWEGDVISREARTPIARHLSTAKAATSL